MPFNQLIIQWYHSNARKLPWRNNDNPYHIWISEIILQQTRVEQGLPYYHAFIANFPDIYALANAEEREVLQIWQGLGYYSRARNMHKCAKQVIELYQGKFPSTYNELIKLHGIGPYTAAAIASFAFGESKAVVDGNVQRVVARFLGITEAVNEKAGHELIQKFVDEEIEKVNPSNFNQAIMEMGAMVCKPKTPNCANCVLNASCFALKHNKINELPFKIKKVKVKKRYFNYFVKTDVQKCYLVLREGKEIWEQLYEFPMIETKAPINYDNCKYVDSFKHVLTHQIIEAKLWIVNDFEAVVSKNKSIFEVDLSEVGNKYPIHQLMKKMFQLWQHQLTK